MVRFPAEWEAHDATWISWPHNGSDWPGKLELAEWTYIEIVRVLGASERVEILCHDQAIYEQAKDLLTRSDVTPGCYRLHLCPTNRSWLRDSAPIGVMNPKGEIAWQSFHFNAWARYPDFELDQKVPGFIAEKTGLARHEVLRGAAGQKVVLEGGAIDSDGQGTLLVTDECLLSDEQVRNPGMSRSDYEAMFARSFGITKVIWLSGSVVGDDTHGHVDDVARFVGEGTVVLAYEANPEDENHQASVENWKRLSQAVDAHGTPLRVIRLPFPAPVSFEDFRLPASYANFFIGNKTVLVPTFNDKNDRVALSILSELFPERDVVGIYCRDLVLGQGTLHCLTQQQPSPNCELNDGQNSR